MGMIKNNLIVLTDYDDFKVIEPHLLEQCDLLAMTPSAMFACQERRLKYFVSDDFYHYREFRTANLRLIQETDELFSLLDKKYSGFLNFPRAFKGNIYPFLVHFAGLHYISKVGREVSRQYKKIYLIGMQIERDLFKVNVTFSLSGLWLSTFDVNSKRGLNFFAACLSGQCVWLKFNKPRKWIKAINKYQILFLGKLVYKRIISILKSDSLKTQKGKKKIIFVMLDAYEVKLLKKYLPEFLCFDPTIKLLQIARDDKSERLNLKPLFLEELKDFVKDWFHSFEKYIFGLFVSYHNNVLCRLNSFSESVKEVFGDYRPSALFYSVCALLIHEDICAYFANQMNIPVFYFQHAGVAQSAFSVHPYQRYLEHNDNIMKINIFQGKKEKENLSKNTSVNGQALGSIKLYNIYIGRKKNILLQKKRRILYCPSPSVFYYYKDYMVNNSDKDLFEINQNVIEVANKFDVRMDIKVNHTRHEADDYFYFRTVIKKQKSAKFRILTGFLAETIINNYGLFLSDFIVTAMLPVFMILDAPIILYLKGTSTLRQESIADMRERFYFANSKSDFEKYLDLFVRGELPSKFSHDFVDKYAFSIDGEDPGTRISKYIRKQLNGRGGVDSVFTRGIKNL